MNFIRTLEDCRTSSFALLWRHRIPDFLKMLEAILCLARRGIDCYVRCGVDEVQAEVVRRELDRHMAEATKRMAPYVCGPKNN